MLRRSRLRLIALFLVALMAVQPGDLWPTFGALIRAIGLVQPQASRGPTADVFNATFARTASGVALAADTAIQRPSAQATSTPGEAFDARTPPPQESKKALAPKAPTLGGIGQGASPSQVQGWPWTWGWDFYGQLGDGTATGRAAPLQVTALSSVTVVAAGLFHSVVRKSDGTVWTFGRNADGQLGLGSTTDGSTPAQITGLSSVSAVASGQYHSLALKQRRHRVGLGPQRERSAWRRHHDDAHCASAGHRSQRGERDLRRQLPQHRSQDRWHRVGVG